MGGALKSIFRTLTWPWRRFPKTAGVLTGLGVLGALAIVGSNAYILLKEDGKSTSKVGDVPAAEVAIVPGALVQPNGKMSVMLGDRVRDAARLWHSGKVEKILVSGDHHSWAYDEPDTMRKALVRHGGPGRGIFEDHAGFDTWPAHGRG